MWREFLSNLWVKQSLEGDGLLAQFISENIFNELLKAHFDAGQCVPKPSMKSLSAIEENAMRNVCGYVPMTQLPRAIVFHILNTGRRMGFPMCFQCTIHTMDV